MRSILITPTILIVTLCAHADDPVAPVESAASAPGELEELLETARKLVAVPEDLVPTQFEMSRDVKKLLARRAAMADAIEAIRHVRK